MEITKIKRNTKETQIEAELNLYGSGLANISTGIGFFDHMLTLFAKHGGFDIMLNCSGDTNVDDHHTLEDCGIVLGSAFKKALGDFSGITRFGNACIPMDECLCRAVVDISNRPFIVYDVPTNKYSEYSEFFRAFAFNSGINMHITLLYGENAHHKLEAAFKALSRALRMAVTKDAGISGIPSTKGVL